jgi:tetratricopeptide (TPR) repeat protein
MRSQGGTVVHHPTAAELEGLVFGGNSAERTRAVIAHLLRGCGTCSSRLAPYFPGLFGRRSRHGAPPPLLEIYDGAVDRALAAARESATAPLVEAPEQKKQWVLELLATGGLEALLNAPPGLQGGPTCEALLERSWAVRHENPAEMVQLAHAATLMADRLTDAEFSPERLLELRCRAWIELGNARRTNDELELAEEALGRATELFLLIRQDELLMARLFTAWASLYGARRLFELALTTFDIAAGVYRHRKDQHLLGRTLIMKDIFTGYSGNAEEAVRFIQQGLASVDERRDPGLVLSALQSRAWLLVDCGRPREALFALWDLRRRRLDPGGEINKLKLRWLEGHIFAGQGKLGLAERALGQVQQGFEEAGLPYKSALAGLELGAVWLRQGRPSEAEEVVLECTEVFLALRIERETLASVIVLRKAAEMQRLTLGLLNPVIERLRREDRE